ncbi:MAG: diguanylate cyclase [Thermodesulfovibrionia bacterium]
MKKPRILLVEDNRLQAEFIMDFLKKKGYETLLAENGASAIKIAKTTPVDLILLDLILPDISGNEVCRWLRHNQDTKDIPIIILTAKADTSDKVAGLEAGADDYLPKPFDEAELNARIYAAMRTKALQDELKQRNKQLEELTKRLELMAITDHLTGIYNRRHFEKIIETEFAKVLRYNLSLSCLMIDIDHFKGINDRYGHDAGDYVLKKVSELVSLSLREVDVLARWGGEEFIVLLPNTTKDDAKRVADRILKTISDYKFNILPMDERVTVSIGVASVEDERVDKWERLIKVADDALYKAKTMGRNRVESF